MMMCKTLEEDGLVAILNKTGPKLRILNLNWTNVIFTGVTSLTATFPLLEEIDLGESRVFESSLLGLFLKAQRSLKRLKLRSTFVNLGQISLFSRAPLEELDLTKCEELWENGLMDMLNKTSNTLRILNLASTKITFAETSNLSSASLPNLEEINLINCKHLSTQGLIALLGKTGDKLKLLNLAHTNITVPQISEIIGIYPHLQNYIYT